MFTRNDAIAAETYWADRLGIPEALAHAIAQVESRHDPYAKGDYVGGDPTSFGDYQLHKGGELGSLTPAQAYNPSTNARVALTELQHVMQTHPYVTDPGALAALAQRPGDPHGYALSVDAAMQTGGTAGSAQPASFFGFHAPSNPLNSPLPGEHLFDKTAGAIVEPFVAVYKLLTNSNTWIRVGLFVGGIVFVIIGARVAFL